MVVSAHSHGLQAVILDWAGTTVDHGSRAPVQAMITLFACRSISLSEAEARGPMGRGKREHIAAILALPRVSDAWSTAQGTASTEADIDRLYADFLPLQREALANHADVIVGVPEVVVECRRRGLKIGGSTGYSRSLMDMLEPLARAQGYAPDVSICADDVPCGRPAPWMLFRAVERLGVFPMSRVVVVDDTPVGIEAGRHAGAWTVGVSRTGNGLGLSRAEVEQLDRSALNERLAAVAADLEQAGAQHVIESVADLVPVHDLIEARPR
jgi:phosphonoacetaldehyde hydrolase